MINFLACLAYFGLLCGALTCLLLVDILLDACPQAAILPYLVILAMSLVLPMIAARAKR